MIQDETVHLMLGGGSLQHACTSTSWITRVQTFVLSFALDILDYFINILMKPKPRKYVELFIWQCDERCTILRNSYIKAYSIRAFLKFIIQYKCYFHLSWLIVWFAWSVGKFRWEMFMVKGVFWCILWHDLSMCCSLKNCNACYLRP